MWDSPITGLLSIRESPVAIYCSCGHLQIFPFRIFEMATVVYHSYLNNYFPRMDKNFLSSIVHDDASHANEIEMDDVSFVFQEDNCYNCSSPIGLRSRADENIMGVITVFRERERSQFLAVHAYW